MALNIMVYIDFMQLLLTYEFEGGLGVGVVNLSAICCLILLKAGF